MTEDEAVPANGVVLEILEGRSVWCQDYRKRAQAMIAWRAASDALIRQWPTDEDVASEEDLMKALSKVRASLGA